MSESRTLRWRLTSRGLGIDYEFLDPMQCSGKEWKEAHQNRVRGSEVVQAMRSFGGDDARLKAIDILTKRNRLVPFGLDRIDGHELFDLLGRAIDDSLILVLKRRAKPVLVKNSSPRSRSP
jgi:hypothetical protein